MEHKIGFIGGGNMATSLIGGLVHDERLGIEGNNITVFEPNADKARVIASDFGVHIATDNSTLVAHVDIVVVAVKPQVLQSILQPLSDAFARSQPLIISVVAGISSDSIQSWLRGEFAVVRVMPNTPALVGAGASGMHANSRVSNSQRALAQRLMNAVGVSAWVVNESDIDTITALSGSGPAYFMLFIKYLVEAAVEAGLSEDTALRLATQTAAGAAELISQSKVSLQTLIDNVTSPGGTTEQALNAFYRSKLDDVVNEAFNAARQRSQELARELG